MWIKKQHHTTMTIMTNGYTEACMVCCWIPKPEAGMMLRLSANLDNHCLFKACNLSLALHLPGAQAYWPGPAVRACQ